MGIRSDFLPIDPTNWELVDADDLNEASCTRNAAQAILQRLYHMRDIMSVSHFVRRHCFIGTSLLFVTEAAGSSASVYVIDFAKTSSVPDHVNITHLDPWEPGNHEDGILLGMSNVIQCWERVLADL